MSTISIRPLKNTDTAALLVFANALISEDLQIGLSGTPLTLAAEKKYVAQEISAIKKHEKIHLVAVSQGAIVGSVEIRRGGLRRRHQGEIGISIAQPFRGAGLGETLMKRVMIEGKKLGLRMIMLHCFEHNKPALSLYAKMGFVRAGLLPDAYFYRGTYVGEITLYKNL